jgi:hypothetical protein
LKKVQPGKLEVQLEFLMFEYELIQILKAAPFTPAMRVEIFKQASEVEDIGNPLT